MQQLCSAPLSTLNGHTQRRICIDLFSGCGGLSLGLHAAGFDCLMALEAHPDAFSTYRANLIDTGRVGDAWPDWLDIEAHDVVDVVHDHAEELSALRGEVDLVAGGPPCQGFSLNGRRDPDDPRSLMVGAYLDVVALVRPRLVFFENVRGFVSMRHPDGGTYAEVVKARLDELGYDAWEDVLPASEWGVPQRRPRYFCIGAKKGRLPETNPFQRLRVGREEFLRQRGLGPGPTPSRDALSDLSLDSASPALDPVWGRRGFTAVERRDTTNLTPYQRLMRLGSGGQPTDRRIARHRPTTVERFGKILDTCPPGICLRPADRQRLGIGKRSTTPLDSQMPAPTVTTLPDDLIHYSEPRAMSVREHARLQSFPDWFSFHGPYTTGGLGRRDACPRYTQVGNAVPPLLAEAVGETLVGILADQELPEVPDAGEERQEGGNTFRQTSGDAGRLTGVFVGRDHEGATGTLERTDLTAAFGASR